MYTYRALRYTLTRGATSTRPGLASRLVVFTSSSRNFSSATLPSSWKKGISNPDTTASTSSRAPIVAVGLSGGVDSAVTALLLKEKGFDVRPVFMVNWDPIEEQGICPGEKDKLDALTVARHLGLDLLEVNFVKEYWLSVFEEMLEGYKHGITPNPDLLCNRFVKFAAFHDHAINTLGADYVAFGHYARVLYPRDTSDLELRFSSKGRVENYTFDPLEAAPPGSGAARLISAVDPVKDQTYFLSHVLGGSFDRLIFPVGQLQKTQVREIAKTWGLPVAQKQDSTGLCFVGPRSFKNLVGGYIPDDDLLRGPVIALHDLVAMVTVLTLTSRPYTLKPQWEGKGKAKISPKAEMSSAPTRFTFSREDMEFQPPANRVLRKHKTGWNVETLDGETIDPETLVYQAIGALTLPPYDGQGFSTIPARPLFSRSLTHAEHDGLTSLTEVQKIRLGGLRQHLYTARKLLVPKSQARKAKTDDAKENQIAIPFGFSALHEGLGIAVVTEKPEPALVSYSSILLRAFNWLSPPPSCLSFSSATGSASVFHLSPILDVEKEEKLESIDAATADLVYHTLLQGDSTVIKGVTCGHVEFALRSIRRVIFPLVGEEKERTSDSKNANVERVENSFECYAKSRSTEGLFKVRVQASWVPLNVLGQVPIGAGNKLQQTIRKDNGKDENNNINNLVEKSDGFGGSTGLADFTDFTDFAQGNYKAIKRKEINGETHELCYRIYFVGEEGGKVTKENKRAFMAAGQSVVLYRRLPSPLAAMDQQVGNIETLETLGKPEGGSQTSSALVFDAVEGIPFPASVTPMMPYRLPEDNCGAVIAPNTRWECLGAGLITL